MADRIYTRLGIIHFILTLPILLAGLFGLRISDFKWHFGLKDFLLVLILFFLLREIPFFLSVGKGKQVIETLFSLEFLNSIFVHFLYPSIVEEFVFRGLLLTGLLSVGVRSDISNIIQAFIFGFIHIIGKGDISITGFLSCFAQTYIGFIIGKLYLQTESLTPCLMLHALFDAFKIM